MARSLFDLAARQGVKLTLLDIGGGFPGWDGSESVYKPIPREVAASGAGGGQVPLSDSARTSSAPSATVQSVLGVGSTRDKDGDRDSIGGSPGTTVTQADGAAGGGDEGATTSAPPLSLAEIAQVTLPVLDELFPPGSGVQVNLDTG